MSPVANNIDRELINLKKQVTILTNIVKPKRWLNLKEAMDYTGLSRYVIISAYHKNKLKGYHPTPRSYLFHPWDLDEFITRKEPAEIW